jgi:hypothetical protein
MKIGSLFITLFISLFLISSIVGADVVPWTTEQYTAEANGNMSYGPPFPVVSGASVGSNNSFVQILPTEMYVKAKSFNSGAYFWAYADFYGTYTASSSNPYFLFTYDGTYTTQGWGYTQIHDAWLEVKDITSNTTLYNDTQLALDGNSRLIYIPTISGHEISVAFGARAAADCYIGCTQEESVSLNYAMAVVPEPVSAILFATGGVFLAGRRYLKQKTV